MTNEQALLIRRIELMKDGKLKPTNRTILFEGEFIPEPEEALTASSWAKQGRIPKPGAEAHKLKIWMKRQGGGFYNKIVNIYGRSQTEEVSE